MHVKIGIEKQEASAASISQVLLKIPKFVDILTMSQASSLLLSIKYLNELHSNLQHSYITK